VCLRWQRKHLGLVRRGAAAGVPAGPAHGVVPSHDYVHEQATTAASGGADDDVTAALERRELAQLLDRAMGHLPHGAREMLVERYIDELPPAEIAARRGLTENAAAVRLHRGRDALRRVLTTQLRDEAVVYGLVDAAAAAGDADAEGWQETRIWCPRCGAHRLEGRFVRDQGAEFFRVRCPGCRNLLGGDFSSRHPALNASAVLGDVKGYKPALSRVSAWWHDYARRGLAAGVVPCFNCGGPAKVMLRPPDNIHPTLRDIRGIFMACPSCGKSTIYSAVGYALASPAVQAFWRKHPRMRALPDGEVRWQDRPAVAVRFESLTGAERIEIFFDRDTLEMLHTEEGAGGSGT
jgi:RNA polymerase sigma factor (sigma-70 family)